jgi:heptose I phosphotransferase
MPPTPDTLTITPRYRPLFQAAGLTAQSLFTDPRIVVWRSITERQNCTLDLPQGAGQTLRLHVKRFEPTRAAVSPAEEEARGIAALERQGIPTAPLVAFGKLPDGRSVVVTEDLAGFRAGDKAVAAGLPFESLLAPTADLAARLHAQGLHHRDLYLCHFFVAADSADAGAAPQLRLIDAARVRPLPTLFTRTRWIVKDLAQFWYSTLSLPVTDDQRTRWLARYAQSRGLGSTDRLRRKIERKVAAIARHDRNLKAAQPTRNVSIPGG